MKFQIGIFGYFNKNVWYHSILQNCMPIFLLYISNLVDAFQVLIEIKNFFPHMFWQSIKPLPVEMLISQRQRRRCLGN